MVSVGIGEHKRRSTCELTEDDLAASDLVGVFEMLARQYRSEDDFKWVGFVVCRELQDRSPDRVRARVDDLDLDWDQAAAAHWSSAIGAGLPGRFQTDGTSHGLLLLLLLLTGLLSGCARVGKTDAQLDDCTGEAGGGDNGHGPVRNASPIHDASVWPKADTLCRVPSEANTQRGRRAPASGSGSATPSNPIRGTRPSRQRSVRSHGWALVGPGGSLVRSQRLRPATGSRPVRLQRPPRSF
jgi:hypothetical protein